MLNEKANIIEEKNKTITENNKKLEEKNKIIEEKTKINEDNINFNTPNKENNETNNVTSLMKNSSIQNKGETNLFNEFLQKLEKLQGNENQDLITLISVYKSKALQTENNCGMNNINVSPVRTISFCERNLTCKCEKCIQLEMDNKNISKHEIKLSIIEKENTNKIDEKVLNEKNDILLHQMLKQKAVFQVERKVFEI